MAMGANLNPNKGVNMQKVKWLWGMLLVAALAMAGCGGGGGSSSSAVSGGTDGAQGGIAVDPYVIGAVFAEIGADGQTIQTSNESNEQGIFSFSNALKNGSIIVITENRGIHNGVPFTGTLKRKVDSSENRLVTSPLTTLLAEGATETDIVSLLDAAGIQVEAADLTKNPVELAPTKPGLLIGAIAANAARTLAGEQSGALSPLLKNLFQDLAPLVKKTIMDGANARQNINAAAGAAVAIVNLVVSEVQSQVRQDNTTNIESALNTIAGGITDQFITEVYEESETGNVEIVTDNGSLTIVTPSATISGYLEKGFAALNNASETSSTDALLSAVTNFNAAAALVDTDTSATLNEKDTALFFGAFSQLASLANPYSDLVDNGLNNVGDILDAFGFNGNDLRSNFDLISHPGTALSSDAPTTADLQAFLFNKVSTELTAAVARFNRVSNSFNHEWADPSDQQLTEFDYADALFMKGLAQAMLAQLNIQEAYEIDVDIDAEDRAMLNNPDRTKEEFLTANPNVGKLKADAETKLATAKTHLGNAIDTAQAAVAAIEAETDTDLGQQNDFISFYTETCNWNQNYSEYTCAYDATLAAADLAAVKQGLVDAKTGLTEGTTTINGVSVDVAKFFTGVDFREKTPAYTGNLSGMFPDPTLGGVLKSGININEDLDEDSRPDILNGYTQLSDTVVTENMTERWLWLRVANKSWYLQLKSDHSFFLGWDEWTQVERVEGMFTGSWLVDNNGQLVLTSSGGTSSLFATATMVLNEWTSDSFFLRLTLAPSNETVDNLWFFIEDYHPSEYWDAKMAQ